MKLRDKYVSTIFAMRRTLGYNETDFYWYFKYPISPLRKNNDGTYNYAIIGKIVEIDYLNDVITMECSNKKTYKLYINLTDTDDPNWYKIDVGVNTKAVRPRENPILFYKPNFNLSGAKDPYFKKDQLYMAIWKDDRELTEINRSIKSSNKNDVFLNFTDSYVLSLQRY